MIYLDNAATTFPKPETVYSLTFKDIRKYGANPGRSGHELSIMTSKKVYKTRQAVKDFFNAENPESVAFTLNCTMGINMLIKGIVRQGDHVVISNLEHNAVMRPVEKLKNQNKIQYSVAKICECDDNQTVENFKKAIRPNTTLVICTHASNVFGIKTPIHLIGKLCKNEGITFMVDAAQTAGICSIDMQKDNIDVLCIASHKGLYAFSGTGIIINQSGKKMNTIIEGGTGSNSFSLLQPDIMPDVLESGTQNVGGIISIYYGIKEIEKIGIEKIQNHEMKLVQTAYNSFKDMGNIILYTNYPTIQTHVPVLSFNINGLDSEETVAKLSDMGFCLRAGLHCAPMAHYAFKTDKIGTVRLAPSMFTSQKDIKDLINAVKSIKYL